MPFGSLRSTVVRKSVPFDLVVANILARPLIAMAGDMARTVSPGDRVVLSGFLGQDGARVLRAYQARGFRLMAQTDIQDWRTMILKRMFIEAISMIEGHWDWP